MFQRVRARLRLHRMTQRKKRTFAAIDTRLRRVAETQGDEEAFRQQVRGVFTGEDPRPMLVPGEGSVVLHRPNPWSSR